MFSVYNRGVSSQCQLKQKATNFLAMGKGSILNASLLSLSVHVLLSVHLLFHTTLQLRPVGVESTQPSRGVSTEQPQSFLGGQTLTSLHSLHTLTGGP